jgi:hypothetical protein
MPIAQMRAMAEALCHHIVICNSLLGFLEVEIERREREPLRRRGLFVVKDWDGTGSRTNRLWRGGGPHPPVATKGRVASGRAVPTRWLHRH